MEAERDGVVLGVAPGRVAREPRGGAFLGPWAQISYRKDPKSNFRLEGEWGVWNPGGPGPALGLPSRRTGWAPG